ncbi:Fc.00g087600.m01.CDS01 [Cosmosporella sp. VM-42]
MLFPEEDAPLLKTWIVKRIENTSDADSDVLAEYVISLLQHDGDRDAVRKLCEEEIPDFLTEEPKAFLDDVFRAITYKTYLPGALPAPEPGSMTVANPFDGAAPNGSRKRGFHDRDYFDAYDSRDEPQQGGRVFKQARRGGRGGRGDIRGRQQPPMHGLPPRPDLPAFDPSNPMEAFMQLQAMGMQYPGMPKFPPTFDQGRNQQRKRGRCRDFDTKGYCSRGSTCKFDHGNESIFVPSMGQGGEEYDPNEPIFSMANPQNQLNPFGFSPDMGRGRGGRRGRGSRKGGARAPFSAEGPVNDRSKTTIVIENIPEESFSEEAVQDFFSQFGTILEISMQPYKHLAIVKYEKWGSANAAYRSPKVIFDNRFVKVFWYKDEADGLPPSIPLDGGNRSNGQDQSMSQEPEPEIDLEEFQRRQDEAQKQHQERETKRADLERQRLELEKQQQELLAKHREENEKLQAKLTGQTGDGTPSSGTDMLRAKLAALEQEAKMLGIDPNAEEDYGPYPPRGGYRGRGGYRSRGYAPRGRGSFRGRGGMHAQYAQYSIDNRPKKLAVKGVDFTSSEKDELLRHFLLNLGEFESVDTTPSVTHVSFQDRKTAEKFYYTLHNKELPGVEGKLDLSWVNTPLPPVGDKPVAADRDRDVTIAAGEEAPRGESPDPAPREERVVNMDYEVADEDAWGDL